MCSLLKVLKKSIDLKMRTELCPILKKSNTSLILTSNDNNSAIQSYVWDNKSYSWDNKDYSLILKTLLTIIFRHLSQPSLPVPFLPPHEKNGKWGNLLGGLLHLDANRSAQKTVGPRASHSRILIVVLGVVVLMH